MNFYQQRTRTQKWEFYLKHMYVMTIELEWQPVEQFSRECSFSSWGFSSSSTFFAFEASPAFSCSCKTCSCKACFFHWHLLHLLHLLLHLENFFLPSDVHLLDWFLLLTLEPDCFFSREREPRWCCRRHCAEAQSGCRRFSGWSRCSRRETWERM